MANCTRWDVALRDWAHLAESTSDAYSYQRYGAAAWRACIALLYRRGYNSTEAIAILYSKIMRVAGDCRPSTGAPTSADLARFLDGRWNPGELQALVDDYVLGIFGPESCARCDALLTDTQAQLSRLRGDVDPLCKDCISRALTLEKRAEGHDYAGLVLVWSRSDKVH